MSTATNTLAITESINDEYEYIQYNEHLSIIHSIKNDMYQMQSIIIACKSNKRVNDWFRNQSTQNLLSSVIINNVSTGITADERLYENRYDLSNELRRMYVHRLLENHVAIWSSPKYA